jgi:hypothetical protein
MLMVLRMPLALLPANAAREGARLHDRPRELRLEFRLPREDLARGAAHISAIQAQANAADHGAYVGLTEVGVRARGAALRAVEACVDARNQGPGFDRGSSGMCLQDLPSVGHDVLPSSLRSHSLAPPRPGQALNAG